MTKMRLAIHPIFFTFLVLLVAQESRGQSAADLIRKMDELNAYPELIVVNGRIATMDESLTQVQAMAVKNNRIIALGTNDRIRFLAGPKTEVLDAKGRLVLPGMIDVHTHPNMWGVEPLLGLQGDVYSKRYNDPQLKIVYALGNDQATILRELERVVRQRAQEMGPGKWIWVALFGGKSIPESNRILGPLFGTDERPGPVTREFLDALAPNNPVSILRSGPNNTKAKELMEKYSYNGQEINGYQQPNFVAYEILLRNRVKEAADLSKNSLMEWAKSGFTTFGDHYYGAPSIMAANKYLVEKGEMPVRWGWYIGTLGMTDNFDHYRFFYKNLGNFQGVGNDYIWNGGVANESWDGDDNRCTRAKPLPQNSTFRFASDCSTIDQKKSGGYINVKSALDAGLHISYLHSGVNDGTYDALFTLLEEAIASGQFTLEEVRNLRISTDHNDMIRPDQIANIAKYGIRVGFRGWQSTSSGMKRFFDGYGEQYMQWMTPMKSVVNAGGRPYFGGDFWVGKVPYYAQQQRDYPQEWDGNIWAFIEFFVTRKGQDGTIYASNESMDRINLMKALTIWGAESLMREKHIGSLEVGKLADFIVLDKDFFTVPDEQIDTIRTVLTVVGGKVIYRSPDY